MLNADDIELVGTGVCVDTDGSRFTRQQGTADDLAACKALCDERRHCMGLEYSATAEESPGCSLLGKNLAEVLDGNGWIPKVGTGDPPIAGTGASPDTSCYRKPAPATGV